MNKAYTRINWQNTPSTQTPIDEDNLNIMDAGIDEIDDRVVVLDNQMQTDEEAITQLQNGKVDKKTNYDVSRIADITILNTLSSGKKIGTIRLIKQNNQITEGNIYNGVIVDSSLSSSSTNPVQNKVINTALADKVDKVSGKGLSTNDYTDADKEKLDGIEPITNEQIDALE